MAITITDWNLIGIVLVALMVGLIIGMLIGTAMSPKPQFARLRMPNWNRLLHPARGYCPSCRVGMLREHDGAVLHCDQCGLFQMPVDRELSVTVNGEVPDRFFHGMNTSDTERWLNRSGC
jgi:hypothetical protein